MRGGATVKFYQACFGKPNNINWELFNVSADMPAKLRAMYEKSENSNTPQNLNKDDMLGDDKSPLCMLEILSQDDSLAISRILYGMTDNMGRPTMLAHGFMFENAAEMLKDPNNLLAVADANFKCDTEATKQIPEELIYNNGYDLNSAMELCKTDKAMITKLMACVYYSLRSATPIPIYIVSERYNEIIRPLTYCIYSLLPYTLRVNLSISNANNFQRAQFKSLMFVGKQYPNTMYFNADTGETNIDLTDIESHKENYPFLEAINKYDDYSQYCALIQEQLDKMKLANSNDYNALKIADTLLAGAENLKAADDKELMRIILEFLQYAPIQNAYVDSFLTEIFGIYNSRNLMPNEAMMKRLQVRTEKSTVRELSDIYKTLHLKSLINGGMGVIVDFLAAQRKESFERFAEWCKYIFSIENGTSYIENYYEKMIHLSTDLSQILSLYKESAEFISFSRLYNSANNKCYTLAREKLLKFDGSSLADILEEYSNTFAVINAASGAPMRKENINSLIDEYWRCFTFDKMEFMDSFITNLQCMEAENPKYKKVKQLIELYEYVRKSSLEYSVELMLSDIENRLEILELTGGFTPDETEVIAPKVQDFIVSNLRRADDCGLVFWVKAASFGKRSTNVNPFKLLIDCGIRAFTDDECFEKCLEEGREVEKYAREYIVYIEALMDKTDNKSEVYRLLKHRAADLSDLKNAAARERRKQQKTEGKIRRAEMREESEYLPQHEKKGFSIGNLFNSKRKK